MKKQLLLTLGVFLTALFTTRAQTTFTTITNGSIVTDLGSGLGCAWGDYDNDGFIDLIITSAFNGATHTAQTNLLYHNNGDGSFTKVTNSAIAAEARDWRSCSWVDYDNDGNLDLFVTSVDYFGFPAENELFQNNGNGTFTKMTTNSAGAAVSPTAGISESAVWADYDRDGFVDLYVVREGPDWLFHNGGDGTFIQVMNTNVGIVQDDRNSYNAMWEDYDNDGWPDLFVTVFGPDFIGTNFLYQNQQNGTFKRIVQGRVATDNEFSIGCAWGDYDNDGYPDLFVVNGLDYPLTNSLYHNNGDGTFTKKTGAAVGPIASDVAYFTQCAWGDYDNDGYLDLFVSSAGSTAVVTDLIGVIVFAGLAS